MEMWTKEVFESLVGELVMAYALEGPESCQLTVSKVIGASPAGEEAVGFSVIFQCDGEIVGQGCMRIEHDSQEPMVLFVSPKSKVELEAVFN